MNEPTLTLEALHVYPIKSCAGARLDESLVIETGLEFDRAWMVVDADGQPVTQRRQPRLQLVQPTLRTFDLRLKAPGMLALHLALDAVEAPCRVQSRGRDVAAYEMGALAAQWFSDFLGARVRLVRFDPAHDEAAAFVDEAPLHLVSTASLQAFERRVEAAGAPPSNLPTARFRPNLVLAGLDDAHGEDFFDEIAFEAEAGDVTIRLTGPCIRCEVPDVDPETAETGRRVAATLAGYRQNPRLHGAVTFGMQAVVVGGVDRLLRTGAKGRATIRF